MMSNSAIDAALGTRGWCSGTSGVTGGGASHLPRLAAVLALAVAAACSTTVETDSGDTTGIADPLDDGYDECAERDWYGDGQCDTGCLDPDPDCISAECDDACAGYCDASWSGEALPTLPADCTAEMCDCGEPPVECPDLCENQCYGEPLPDEIPPDCPSFTCDCAEVTADPEASGLVPLAAGPSPCSAASPDAATMAEVNAADNASQFLGMASAASSSRRTIPVVFHVIRRTRPKYGGTGEGDVSRGTLIKQVKVLNRAYARTPFKFKLSKITRTTNTSWFFMTQDSAEEASAKRNLHRGGMSTLNVYTTGMRGATNGWATFPFSRRGKQDGVVLDHTSTPGGSFANYNLGDTLVHETGHWVGLLHTFEDLGTGNGCNNGDGVGDTPAEDIPSFDCKVGRDTCPNNKGKDPVRNYMDYGNDACKNNFTAGQRGRMGRQAKKYRPASGSQETGGDDGCGDGQCTGDETDSSCPADCGCAAIECAGVSPFGCYCDADCAATGDCCADVDTCE